MARGLSSSPRGMLQIQLALRRLFQTARRLPPSPSRRLLPRPRAGLLVPLSTPHRATLGTSWSSAAAVLPPWARRQQHTAAMIAEGAATPPSGRLTARRARAGRAQPEAAQASAAIDGTPVAVVGAAAAAVIVEADAAGNGLAVAAALEQRQEQQEQEQAAPGATPTLLRKKSARPPAKSPSQLVLGDQAALEFKAGRIAELLGRLYPNPPIPLDHGTTFQLLCAVLLSAQVGARGGRWGVEAGHGCCTALCCCLRAALHGRESPLAACTVQAVQGETRACVPLCWLLSPLVNPLSTPRLAHTHTPSRSAMQTTDKKVNECTPALFKLAPDAHAMAAADLADIAACIRTLGLAPTKARNLKAMSQASGACGTEPRALHACVVAHVATHWQNKAPPRVCPPDASVPSPCPPACRFWSSITAARCLPH